MHPAEHQIEANWPVGAPASKTTFRLPFVWPLDFLDFWGMDFIADFGALQALQEISKKVIIFVLKMGIRDYFLRVLVAQNSCKTAPNHFGGDQKNQVLIRDSLLWLISRK